MQRYGVENAAQAQTIKEKIEKTCLKKYGVKASFQAPEVKEKISVSLNAHYGVDHPMHVDEVKAKLKKTFRDRYGGILHGSQALSRKIKTTMLDRYGVEHPLQSDEIKLNFPWKTRARNIHNTMKRNGTYSRQASCAEAKFHELLTKKFGNDEVERHVVVNGWCIDFYVSAIDVYIQFDGVYWHGLDRPIDVIKQSDRPRDQIIYKTWLRDREQNVWFEQNNKKLYRVTDMQDMHAEVEKIHSGHTNRRQTWR